MSEGKKWNSSHKHEFSGSKTHQDVDIQKGEEKQEKPDNFRPSDITTPKNITPTAPSPGMNMGVQKVESFQISSPNPTPPEKKSIFCTEKPENSETHTSTATPTLGLYITNNLVIEGNNSPRRSNSYTRSQIAPTSGNTFNFTPFSQSTIQQISNYNKS